MKPLLMVCLLAAASCLLTSSHFSKKGINMRDGIYEKVKAVDGVATSCNVVNLNVAPYNYNGTVRSGYMSVGNNKGSSALGFIFYGRENTAQSNLKNYPTIIWLNGGPGSSSQLGNMMELGPFRLSAGTGNQSFSIIRNNFTWVKDYNVLFVDQPVGTGLSYADPTVADPYTHSQEDVASDFYNALVNLYQDNNGCFKQLSIGADKDLFIIGESYAGKYVPAIAMEIMERKKNGGVIRGLKGVSIGDGFTHPYDILAEVGAFSYNVGLLDYQERSRVEQMIINATYQALSHKWNELHDSFDTILDSIVDWAGGVNVYDFTRYTPYPNEVLNTFFNDPAVIQLYKLNPNITFDRHSSNVYKALYEDFMKPVPEKVKFILSENLPVLIYNGQNDIIVETPGTMRWVERLEYQHSEEFRKTPFSTWSVNGNVAGSTKKAGKLELKIVNNAGHMVPMDQAENCLFMIKAFIDPLKSNSSVADV